jgi:hypothetical protein
VGLAVATHGDDDGIIGHAADLRPELGDGDAGRWSCLRFHRWLLPYSTAAKVAATMMAPIFADWFDLIAAAKGGGARTFLLISSGAGNSARSYRCGPVPGEKVRQSDVVSSKTAPGPPVMTSGLREAKRRGIPIDERIHAP